jgi:18S rRNA (guanine1575-N7)-methyltransferase
MDIQEEMCRRAIELLLLPEDQSCLLLDIGCGSGLSGDVLENEGHTWIGMDISSAMLSKYSSNYILSLIFDNRIKKLGVYEVTIKFLSFRRSR